MQVWQRSFFLLTCDYLIVAYSIPEVSHALLLNEFLVLLEQVLCDANGTLAANFLYFLECLSLVAFGFPVICMDCFPLEGSSGIFGSMGGLFLGHAVVIDAGLGCAEVSEIAFIVGLMELSEVIEKKLCLVDDFGFLNGELFRTVLDIRVQ